MAEKQIDLVPVGVLDGREEPVDEGHLVVLVIFHAEVAGGFLKNFQPQAVLVIIIGGGTGGFFFLQPGVSGKIVDRAIAVRVLDVCSLVRAFPVILQQFVFHLLQVVQGCT